MKQASIAALWAFSFWYLGSAIVAFTATSPAVAPILGLTVGVAVWLWQRHLIPSGRVQNRD